MIIFRTGKIKLKVVVGRLVTVVPSCSVVDDCPSVSLDIFMGVVSRIVKWPDVFYGRTRVVSIRGIVWIFSGWIRCSSYG